jgi:hypothetical protein
MKQAIFLKDCILLCSLEYQVMYKGKHPCNPELNLLLIPYFYLNCIIQNAICDKQVYSTSICFAYQEYSPEFYILDGKLYYVSSLTLQ